MTQTRKQDPKKIELTPKEFAEAVRNGGVHTRKTFDWQGWIKVVFIILVPGIALISYVKSIESGVEAVAKDTARQEVWIQNHTAETNHLIDSIHALDKKQGVILEKITRTQQDIAELLNDMKKQP